MKSRTKTAARILATGACAAGLVLGLQGQAFATGISISPTGGGGTGTFNTDPDGSTPGDSIRACDTSADGWGIEVTIDIGINGTIDRTATTRGHAKGYCSPWQSGNIAEGTSVRMYVAKVNGGSTYGPTLYIDVVA
jgi:hypothetical protein